MLAEVLGILNLALLIFLCLSTLRDRSETNIVLWQHKVKLDDLELRITALEKRVSDIEESE